MWENTTSLTEIALRVALLYLGLMLMLRVAGKREVGQLSPLDLLGMLLLSETVSPVLTAQDTSLTAGLVAAAVLLAVAVGIGRASFYSRRLERWVDGTPTVIVEDGKLIEEAARRERITQQELESALHRRGVERLAQVQRAFVEPNGEITVIERRDRGSV
jgi:uncharacterized membrane protein YcaP (DUF421 family)